MTQANKGWRFPEPIKTLSRAYGVHSQVAGRSWLACGAITLLAIAESSSPDPVQLFSVTFPAPLGPYLLLLTANLANVAFCSAYMQLGRTALLHRSLVNKLADEAPPAQRQEVRDLYFALIRPIYSRVFPLTEMLPVKTGVVVYVILKIAGELVVVSVPIIGCIMAFLEMRAGISVLPSPWYQVAWAVALVTLTASSYATAIMVISLAQWIWSSAAERIRAFSPPLQRPPG